MNGGGKAEYEGIAMVVLNVSPNELRSCLDALPKNGIALFMVGICTCGELGRCDEARPTRKFGIIGKRLQVIGQSLTEPGMLGD